MKLIIICRLLYFKQYHFIRKTIISLFIRIILHFVTDGKRELLFPPYDLLPRPIKFSKMPLCIPDSCLLFRIL